MIIPTTAVKKPLPKKPDETPVNRFRRLAKARTNRAIKVIGHVGNLSGTGYESTKAQQDIIFTALRNAIDTAETRFNIKVSKDKPGIEL